MPESRETVRLTMTTSDGTFTADCPVISRGEDGIATVDTSPLMVYLAQDGVAPQPTVTLTWSVGKEPE